MYKIVLVLLLLNTYPSIAQNFSGNWKQLGPFYTATQNAGIIPTVVPYKHNTDIIMAGSGTGGLWLTKDRGKHWNCISDTYTETAIGVTDGDMHPDNADVMYIATGMSLGDKRFGAGVLKTDDGGANWQKTELYLPPCENKGVQTVKINPNHSRYIFATVDNKVYRTINEGKDWAVVNEVDKELCPSFFRLSFDTKNSKGVFAAGKQLWYSKNHGKVWNNLTNNLPIEANDDIERIEIQTTCKAWFAFYRINNGSKYKYYICKSENNGKTWEIQGNPRNLDAGMWFMEYLVNPKNPTIMYCGDDLMRKSIDAGKTFKPLHSYDIRAKNMHVDVRELVPISWSEDGNSDVLLIGNDGGVTITYDGGKTFQSLNSPEFCMTQVWGLGYIPDANGGSIFGGTQDNGMYTYKNATWYHNVMGDAYDASYFPDKPNELVACINGGVPSLTKSIDTGRTWTAYAPYLQAPALNDRPIYNNKISNKIYTGYNDVYTLKAGDKQWKNISNISVREAISALAIAPNDPNYVYFSYLNPIWTDATSKEKFYACENAESDKPVWEDRTPSLKLSDADIPRWTYIRAMTVDPTNPKHIWIGLAYGNVDNYKLYESYDAGKSWAKFAQGLPCQEINEITCHTTNIGYTLYLANDIGVYYRSNTMTEWKPFSTNLPSCIVTDIEIDSANNRLIISTYGRGFWATDLQ